MDYKPNISRKERILILPNNTLRVPEAMFMLEIYASKHIKLPNFDENLYKCICRKTKDLTKIFNISKELLDKWNTNWAEYYDIAPRTKMYEYIDILSSQKFVENTVVLFSDYNAHDSAFTNDYYDGTFEELERYIINNGITAIVLDDVDLMEKLTESRKIGDNLSFFVSKMGYNYQYNTNLNVLMPKKALFDAEKNAYIEVAIISLFEFEDTMIKNIVGGKSNE